jgi:hypothetical protein
VNYRESSVKAKYEADGYRMLRNGAPDFVALKVEGGRIVGVVFVEVKSPRDPSSHEQSVWREIAAFLGVPYKLEVVE